MDYVWILCGKSEIWGIKLQKKNFSGVHFFLLDSSYSLYTKWKEIVNRVQVSERRNIKDQNVIKSNVNAMKSA